MVTIQARGGEFIVDDADAAVVASRRWGIHATPKNRRYYVKTAFEYQGKTASCFLHHFLIGQPLTGMVDHINGDPLDNRRCNLRIVTASQNACNRSLSVRNKLGVHGVQLRHNKYRARIRVAGKLINLGSFVDLEDAVAARQFAEFRYFGEFAPSLCRRSA